MFSWLRRSAPTTHLDPVDAPSRASPPLPPRDPSPSTDLAAPSPPPASAPRSSSPPSSTSAPAAEDARTARNRKKRQQKKKSAQRHKRQSTTAPGSEAGDGDDDDEREPDDDDVGAPAPEADDDLSYLERIGGLKRQREDKARELAAAAAAAGGRGGGAVPGAAGASAAGGAVGSVGASAAGASGAARAGAPLHDAFALPGEAPLDTRGVTAGPEQIEAAQLVGEMLRQGKIRPGATGPLNRISGLPDGAGQVNGLDIPSTHELRKTAKENGLVPFTDDRGMLRIGVRVAPDVVLMHPKDGKGEPILLRM
ncbi:uncharacterized protein RHOBADRAFT_50488 [Rhodotorula graminis WP1]|uniref:Uncharacterized protein n=1 Tax=Rhodotorula graminis (strain WP1) TaxID=578459 RepID=A0A194SBZ4_RHOGW|nr:uncharacterized protein RHOBADRAFT_50488 [Rhodotorula graminis WP1]KPV77965.1 hypothetical protein RHOBADRAFT_50488 [Rhodotorula graminis WP1]